jgi:ribosomal protein L11 methyltransferase
MKYIEVVFQSINAEQSEMLVALLTNAGFEGFEESDGELKAFIKKDEFDKALLEAVSNSINISFTLSEIEQQNWNAQWESSFEPVIVDDFAAVRAGFHQPVTGVKHEIIITPKMSFGTGHHATTYLMMQQMSHIDFTGKAVFDFGTGTGVLAILAEKMGAAAVDAIDIDEWSVENTNENTVANNCNNIRVEMASIINTTNKYDVVLANINLNVLLANMKDIAAVCKTGAIVLFSGILTADESALQKAALENRIHFKNSTEKNNWLCITAQR